jgi:DcuC family C4-dicarboxylate transporter
MTTPAALGIVVILMTGIAVMRGRDVRIVMLASATALGLLAGDLPAIVRTFFNTLASEQFIVPICSAMGFAYVLRESQCDRHLVILLTAPVRRLRLALIPAAVTVGMLVNVAVISQASTAVAVGTVLIPLLRSNGVAPAVVGSALLLGASVGGELLNPGAPELQSVSKRLLCDPRAMQPVLAPLLAVQWLIATAVFWFACGREPNDPAPEPVEVEKLHFLKAIVPLVPLALLLVTGPPLDLLHVPDHWLVDPARHRATGTRLIGLSMIAGCLATAIAVPSVVPRMGKAFFEGAGYAFANIVGIIVTASAFGEGIKALRLTDGIGSLAGQHGDAIWLMASVISFLFALVCGSGMATTESLYQFFMQPDWPATNNLAIGAVVSVAAAAGRTASPAAAVVLLCGTLVGVSPAQLIRRVILPLILATITSTTVAWRMHRV